MRSRKPWYLSKTILGLAVAAICQILETTIGFAVPDEQTQAVMTEGLLSAIETGLGQAQAHGLLTGITAGALAFAGYGRIRAQTILTKSYGTDRPC
ncbi:MAG: hypothetical protein ACPGOY_18965 [Rhodospirillaceae bacterium]